MINKPLVLYSGKLSKKYDSDAGWDIHSAIDGVIQESNSLAISTGLKIGIPEGFVGLIKPRSGLSFNNQIETGAGVIDSSFRGETRVHLYNHGRNSFMIKKGDRIAQLLVIPCDTRSYIEHEDIDDTERGESGFGSSGNGEKIE